MTGHVQRPPARVTQPPQSEGWAMRWSAPVVETHTEWGVQVGPGIVIHCEDESDALYERGEGDAIVSRTVQVGPWVEVQP